MNHTMLIILVMVIVAGALVTGYLMVFIIRGGHYRGIHRAPGAPIRGNDWILGRGNYEDYAEIVDQNISKGTWQPKP
jgi:hypothetical protein